MHGPDTKLLSLYCLILPMVSANYLDAKFSCKCHGLEAVVEIKYPYKIRNGTINDAVNEYDFLNIIVNSVDLKTSHEHFTHRLRVRWQ